MDSFIMNKSIISEQEQNEILSALHRLSTMKTNETIKALKKFSSFFNKEPQGWFEMDIAGWGDDTNYIGMKTAIIEKKIIEFEYYNTKGEKSHRRVEPIKLWFKSGSWYLNAFCLNKQDVRLFKLSRTRNLTITDAMFTERELPTQNPDGEPADAFPNKIMLVMKIAPEMAYRVYDNCDEDEIVKNEDGSITIFQRWDYENNAMYGYILSFGEYAEVLEPKHIRAILRDKGLSIAKKYFLQ
jgi:predicted DNA-binding transcriptional regulator YafY